MVNSKSILIITLMIVAITMTGCLHFPTADICEDNDGDGYGLPGSTACDFSQTDCNDNNAAVNPGATEICDNGLDDDCVGGDAVCPSQDEKLLIISASDNADTHEAQNPIVNSFDNNIITRWSAMQSNNDGTNNVGVSITFDLGGIQEVRKIRFSNYQWDAGRIYQYSIDISEDNQNWINVVTEEPTDAIQWQQDIFATENARYVRMNFISQNQGNWAGLYEFEVWGYELNPPAACVDNDGDTRGSNCVAGTDCNDNNPAVWNYRNCNYNGNACGNYDLCVASCAVPPTEVCDNQQDDDCDGQVDEGCSVQPICGQNGCESGETCSTCPQDCGVCPTGNVWYVDNAASGSNSGASWVNAWESFADIGWNSLQPGDTVFISGGTNSKIYNEGLEIYGIKGAAGNPITIAAGRYAPNPSGHNGKVIIEGPYNGNGEGITVNGVGGPSVDYITLRGFDIRGWTTGINVEDYATNILIDSMNITDWYDLAGVFVSGDIDWRQHTIIGVANVTIKNSNFVTFFNEIGQEDGIYLGGANNTVIHDNYLYIKNQDPMAHTDGIQCGMNCNGLKIYNNVIISSAVYSPEGGGVPLILAAHSPNPVIIYNNFLYMGGVWDPNANWGSGVIDLHGYDIHKFSDQPPTYVFHNTIISNGPRIRALGFTFFGTDSTNAYFKNNLVAQYGLGGSHGGGDWLETFSNSRPSPQTINVNNMGHNLWWREWGAVAINGPFTNGVTTIDSPTWSQWTGTLGGTGVNANPLFVGNKRLEWTDPALFEKQAVMEGTLQAGSPAINQGENIKSMVESLGLPWSDINGNPRDSTPDIGAYQR